MIVQRYALGVEYDGSVFYGFQLQRQSPTVQGCLEGALTRVADHPVRVHCAGRTDTGVHGLCQVVHFDSHARRTERAWILGCNTHLPAAATALWIRPMPGDFDARFSATARRYRYGILNRWVRPAVERDRLAWIRRPLDAAAMHRAAQAVLGEHDFSAFRAVGCQSRTPVREVTAVGVSRRGEQVWLDITANAFLYHMVRNIAGSLIRVGAGEAPVEWLGEILARADRRQAGVTAPAAGLYFVAPTYPGYPELPVDRAATFPRGQDLS